MDWFKELRKIMLELIRMRRQILSGQMTQVQVKEIKSKIMNKVDWGNCRLGLDLVPSVEGEIVDINQCSLIELHKVVGGECENEYRKGTSIRQESEFGTSKHCVIQIGQKKTICIW